MRRSKLYQCTAFSSFTTLIAATLVLVLCFIPCALTNVITKLKYKKATATGAKELKGLLGYLQHRREAPEFGDLPRGGRRWIDRGAGSTSKEIHATCTRLQSPHVFAFTWVINPNPDCIALIDSKDHNRFIGELTEGSIESMFEARGIPPPEYSYIKHNRETEDLTAPHRLNPHSHIILVGTYDDPLLERKAYYMNKSEKKGEDHPNLFWKTAEAEMERLMDRYVGLDWPQKLEQLVAERERAAQVAQEQEIQSRLAEIVQVVDSATLQPNEPEPDCWGETDDGLLWRGWLVTRSTDKKQHDIGIHWQADDLLANSEDTFETIIPDLSEKDSLEYRHQLLEILGNNPDRGMEILREIASQVQDLPTEQGEQELSQDDDQDVYENDLSMDWD